MNDERIIELEIKVAYQEDLVQELNKIVSTQQGQIDRLNATCKLLNEKISSISVGLSSAPSNEELPPHY